MIDDRSPYFRCVPRYGASIVDPRPIQTQSLYGGEYFMYGIGVTPFFASAFAYNWGVERFESI